MQKIVTLSELRRAQDEKTARSRAHPETLNFELGFALRRKKLMEYRAFISAENSRSEGLVSQTA
jgi:hypothetical protein